MYKILFILTFFILASCKSDPEIVRPNPTIDKTPIPACLAIDTDGDGLLDCNDPDIDNDNRTNQLPLVSIKIGCYPKNSKSSCEATANCEWIVETDKCVSKNSCGTIINETSCQSTNGCFWTTENTCTQNDWFPYDSNEYIDSDFDSYGDNVDKYPTDSTEWADVDNDQLPDNADYDDDNDGIPDYWDTFKHDNTEWADTDFDNIGNNIDYDDDNDGIPDMWDQYPLIKLKKFDIDNDFIDNDSDADIDGDGRLNELDKFPYDLTEAYDTDNDLVGDNKDYDDDNDGIPDLWDDFQLDSAKKYDSDKDGFENAQDRFPYNPNEWIDSDNDGVGDNSDAFPFLNTETLDTDNDGVGDNSDADADGDGFFNTIPPKEISSFNLNCYKRINEGTCINESSCVWTTNNRCVPNNSCGIYTSQSTCNANIGCGWGANICDNSDLYPRDRFESSDFDKDGYGDNEDFDDDNDGIPDLWDQFPKFSLTFVDYDNDGLYDIVLPRNQTEFNTLNSPNMYGYKEDYDVDNDGVPDYWDDLPLDASEQFDLDKDGVGNRIDQDLDNDGRVNAFDLYPYDKNEWSDFDQDGIGDNGDWDDDNDGVPDYWDTLFNNNSGFSDMDNDLVPDQIDIDLDGDFYPNGLASLVYNIPNNVSSGIKNPYGVYCGEDSNSDNIPDRNLGASANNFVCSYTEQYFELANSQYVTTVPSDLYIFNKYEWADFDGDDLGDNTEDWDSDNDGVPNQWDDFPLKTQGFSDLDKDGVADQVDSDIDNDGSVNNLEIDLLVSPYGVYCGYDSNNDGTLDSPLVNNFSCIYRNSFDDFEHDGTESIDTDSDLIGDNADYDIDNDGVPNQWDDLPLDILHQFDNDGDGIGNGDDINTPNGIKSQADILFAISVGENIAINQDVIIDQCIEIPEGRAVFSAGGEDYRLIYDGPNNNCMLKFIQKTPIDRNIFIESAVSKLVLQINENKNNITMITSNNPLDEIDFYELQFNFLGQGKILDLQVRNQVRFVRNNIIKKYKHTLTNFEKDLISLRTTNPAYNDFLSVVISGNIVYIDYNENQNEEISIFKTHNPFRKVSLSSNVIHVFKSSNVNISQPMKVFNIDFDANRTSPELDYQGAIDFSNNRANMNVGKLIELYSSNASIQQFDVTSFGHKIFNILNTGSSFTDNDVRDLMGNSCASQTTINNCEGDSLCTWTSPGNASGNYCVVNMSLAKSSHETYYDFKDTDIWLNPNSKDYAMFYFPNQTKIDNSPALFDAGSNEQLDLNPIQEVDLGLGSVYHVGAIGPAKDSDADGYRDENDAFPFDASEWRDSDLDGVGNTNDTDDDNDGALDNIELSFCSTKDNEIDCNNNENICSWSSSSNSCRRKENVYGCSVNNTFWDQSKKCCVDTNNICQDGSDPYVSDTDGDGLTDLQELLTYNTNPINPDSDNDGDTDGEEIANNSNPNDPLSSKDTDGDGLSDKYENLFLIPKGCVNPKFFDDSDNDGLTDYQEEKNYLTNPCDDDSDNDGIKDAEEVLVHGTDPKDADSDDDGLNDDQEIRIYFTNPKNADTDNDSVSDGIEVSDGTDPKDPNSFRDTDQDGEADALDKTPYGVLPYPTCTNTNISGCQQTFTNTQLVEELTFQITEANNCQSYSNINNCENNPIRKLCRWNAVSSKCEAKSINIYQSIIMDSSAPLASCYTLNEKTTLTIRSARKEQRNAIKINNSMSGVVSCSSGTSPFILLSASGANASKLKIDNLRIETGANIPKIIGTKLSSAQNNSIEIVNSEFYSENRNGSSILFALDPALISIKNSTFRSALIDITAPNNVNMNSSIEIKKTQPAVSTVSEFLGNIIYCDLKDHLNTMYNNNYIYSCLNTNTSSLNFEGNIVMLDALTPLLNDSNYTNSSNNIYAWKHVNDNTSMTLRHSRIYSMSKTLNITNGNQASNTINFGILNSSVVNRTYYQWSGSNASSFTPFELPVMFDYNTMFDTNLPNMANLSCNTISNETDTDLNIGEVHPAYFGNSPTRTFWNKIMKDIIMIQIPGAKNEINCP